MTDPDLLENQFRKLIHEIQDICEGRSCDYCPLNTSGNRGERTCRFRLWITKDNELYQESIETKPYEWRMRNS